MLGSVIRCRVGEVSNRPSLQRVNHNSVGSADTEACK